MKLDHERLLSHLSHAGDSNLDEEVVEEILEKPFKIRTEGHEDKIVITDFWLKKDPCMELRKCLVFLSIW